MLKAESTGNEEKDGVDGKNEPKHNDLSVTNNENRSKRHLESGLVGLRERERYREEQLGSTIDHVTCEHESRVGWE